MTVNDCHTIDLEFFLSQPQTQNIAAIIAEERRSALAKHAYLSASASERWLKCSPSVKLCAQKEDRGSLCA